MPGRDRLTTEAPASRPSWARKGRGNHALRREGSWLTAAAASPTLWSMSGGAASGPPGVAPGAASGPASGAPDALEQLLAWRGPIVLSPALGERLAAAYATPPRAYHHLGHIVEVLGWFDWVAARQPLQRWRRGREVAAAMLFHDAIYVAGAKDNEARSAELARQAIGEHEELAGIDASRVVELIELTARHGRLSAMDLAALEDETRLFLDCDLAILAAPPERYRRYCAEIAQEYRAVPAAAYRAGRRAFVAGALALPRLFSSDLLRAELEARGRENLAAELASLG